jgi:hypothetical protein
MTLVCVASHLDKLQEDITSGRSHTWLVDDVIFS